MPNRKFELNATDKNNLIDFKTGKHINPVLSIVCDRIKYYRAKRGIEQKALADQLGVTGNSISNWENGRSRPDVNLLPTIAKALGISLYDLYGIDDPRLQYTDGEQSLVSRFRDLTPGHQKAVNSLIDQLLVTQAIENCPKLTELTRYETGLAAGVGVDVDFDDAGEPFYLYSSRLVDRADSVFVVNGESMEPDYHDGDMVLVERIPGAPDLQYGEIGAFFIENEPYIKVFEKDGLHSLNPEYPPMLAEDYEAVYVIGRVIGTVEPDDIPTKSEVRQFIELNDDDDE